MIHYIYIPGLGDRFDPLRRLALLRWRSRETRATLVPMRWEDKTETYEQKYARIVDVLEKLTEETIILVGESAGGPMALLTFSRHPEHITSTVTLCGYNHGADDISSPTRRHNPAFYSLLQETDALELPPDIRQRITTVYSTLDTVVTPKHTQIDGARQIVLHTPGHPTTITRVLLAGPKRLQ